MRGGGRGSQRYGSLKTVTTNLRPGYLRKNGVPYSERAVFTEHWDVHSLPNGDKYLVNTNVVEDPVYLQAPFQTAIHYKLERDTSKWDQRHAMRDFEEGGSNDWIRLLACCRSRRCCGRRRQVAQVELGGTYAIRMHEDYIERGPGSFLGDFTGMPLSEEGRAKALRYSSSLPSTIERQCLAQSPWVGLYRPLALRIWSEVDESGRVVAWVMAGDYLRDTVRIWMDGRPHPRRRTPGTPLRLLDRRREGDTLVCAPLTSKTAWIRRGVGIPGSDRSTFTVFITSARTC